MRTNHAHEISLSFYEKKNGKTQTVTDRNQTVRSVLFQNTNSIERSMELLNTYFSTKMKIHDRKKQRENK